MKEEMLKEFTELEHIVNTVFGVDVKDKRRKRRIVDARMVYSKIIRERGFTFETIGKYLSKDHTTIVHYIDTVDVHLKQLPFFNAKYNECYQSFMLHKEPVVLNENEKVLKRSIDSLKSQIDSLILEKERMLISQVKYRRLNDIISIIDKRTPKGKESFIENKINQMFNGITKYE